MKYSEIAELTGKSVPSVKMDAQRGKFDKSDEASVSQYLEECVQNPESAPDQPAESSTVETIPPVIPSDESPAADDHSDYVDTHTKSSNKGWEGSRDHLLSLPVGTIYRGFTNILVEIVEDDFGNKHMKQYPASRPYEKRTPPA